MIGPFSTTLVPLSSSSSVDRQVLINVEANAISPDERTFGFIFTKIPFTRRSDEEKKRIKELGPDRPYFQFVCAPLNVFSTSRRCSCHKPRFDLEQQILDDDLFWFQLKRFDNYIADCVYATHLTHILQYRKLIKHICCSDKHTPAAEDRNTAVRLLSHVRSGLLHVQQVRLIITQGCFLNN